MENDGEELVTFDDVSCAIAEMVWKIGLPQSTHTGHFDQAYDHFRGRKMIPFAEFMESGAFSPYVKEIVIKRRPELATPEPEPRPQLDVIRRRR